jgi:transposase
MMLLPSNQFQIFLYPRFLDMRSGYDRLAEICRHELGVNPYNGAVFLFFNRQRDRARIFFYDGSGSCLFSKRLEKGRFKVPFVDPKAQYAMIEAKQLGLLLEGVDLSTIKTPKPWKPSIDDHT